MNLLSGGGFVVDVDMLGKVPIAQIGNRCRVPVDASFLSGIGAGACQVSALTDGSHDLALSVMDFGVAAGRLGSAAFFGRSIGDAQVRFDLVNIDTVKVSHAALPADLGIARNTS